jgi:predicted dehydrogenase
MVDHVLIVGLGSIGKRHLKALKKLRPNCRVTVVSRTSKHTQNKFVDFCAKSIDEAIFKNPINQKISCALICTPATEHLDNAIQLCENGIHVLIEKPISNDRESPTDLFKLDRLIRIIKDKKTKTLIGYVLRHDPAAKKFKKLIDKDAIGEVFHVYSKCSSYLPSWRPDQDYRKSVSANKALGGGVLLELSHEIDYLMWFFGEPESVYAELGASDILNLDVEDSADLILKSKKGVLISLHLDFLNKQTERSVEAFGSGGQIKWDLVKQSVSLQAEEVFEFTHYEDYNYNYEQQLLHFFKCIEEESAAVAPIEDAIKTLKVVELSKQSNKNKSKIFFK